jgi:hypothetical protein
MGFPLPTGTLYQMQHPWPGEEDYSSVNDAERMQRQDNAYHGKFTRPLKGTDPHEPDHNVIDNRCEPIVSTGVDFLLGDDVGFDVSNDDDTPDEEAQTYLDAVWEANIKMPTMAEYEINCAVFGHAFYKLMADDKDMPIGPNGNPYPSLAVLNPMQMRVRNFPVDVRKVARYAFTYPDVTVDKSIIAMRQLTERTDNGGWQIRDQEHRGGMTHDVAGAISLINRMAMEDEDAGWEDDGIVPWNYPWSPIHDCKNLPEPNSYLGKADLRLDLIHLNDKLNFLLSNRQRILYHHGHPKPHYFGIHAHEIENTPGGAVCIPNISARVEQIEMKGDLTAIEEAIKDICRRMDELSHVPAVAVGSQEHLQPASGVALKVAYGPLVHQTMQKRSLRSGMYMRLNQHILELGGFGVARKVTIHWPVMVPTDDLIAAQTAQIWAGLGVSNDTLMQRADPPFDPDVEDEKKEEEADQALAQAQKRMAVLGPPEPPNGPPNGPGGGQQQEGGQGSNVPPPAQKSVKKTPPKKAA